MIGYSVFNRAPPSYIFFSICNGDIYRSDNKAKRAQAKPGTTNVRLALLPTGTVGAVTPPVEVVVTPPVGNVVFHATGELVAGSVTPAGVLSEVLNWTY